MDSAASTLTEGSGCSPGLLHGPRAGGSPALLSSQPVSKPQLSSRASAFSIANLVGENTDSCSTRSRDSEAVSSGLQPPSPGPDSGGMSPLGECAFFLLFSSLCPPPSLFNLLDPLSLSSVLQCCCNRPGVGRTGEAGGGGRRNDGTALWYYHNPEWIFISSWGQYYLDRSWSGGERGHGVLWQSPGGVCTKIYPIYPQGS